ncbi:hypothetical protein Syun_026160 [Stephania yunnanensis]|uniref:CMP-sialic acid transporter 1 n=1 Tax=Stephania yunnanensis TaxID=152371 RepID=A0AAP0ET15_9MAGN
MQWYFVAALLAILTSSQGILTTLSQSNGRYKYDYATVPFLAELLVSSFLLWREFRAPTPPRMTMEWKCVCLFPIPSIIYLIHNNVQFATLTYVDTSTYQIMGNLKIVTTGILFRLFLRRKLSNLQWMAIVLLAVGTTTSQVKGCGEASCDSLFSAPLQGYMLGILSACLSALAGVYTEYLMKKNNDSLFGAIFNMARLLLDDFRGGFENGPWWQRLLNGYGLTTWMVVLNLGSTAGLWQGIKSCCGGVFALDKTVQDLKFHSGIVRCFTKRVEELLLSLSATLLDGCAPPLDRNIMLKDKDVYSTSMAMLLTMVLSIYLFNFRPTLQLFLGIVICMMSLHMYFAPPSVLVDLPVTVKALPESLHEVSIDRSMEPNNQRK